MTDKKPAGFSISELSTVKASGKPFEYEYEFNGEPTGIWLSIVGSQSQRVQDESNRLINEGRAREAAREVKVAGAMKGAVTYERVEDTIDFVRQMRAVRLVGWRGPGQTEGLTKEQAARFLGINDPYSPAAALEMVTEMPEIGDDIQRRSNDLGNFTKGLSRAS